MRRHVRALAASAALVLAIGLVAAVGPGRAADDDPEVKQARVATLKVADLIGQKDFTAARTEAAAVAKKVDDIEKVMQTMKLRSQGGVGLGAKAGAISPDGIEAIILNMGRRPLSPKDLETRTPALDRMTEVVAAVADISLAKGPPKVGGKKKKADWDQWSKDMREGALALKETLAKKDPKAVKDAIVKLNASCSDCHAIWKDK